MHLPGLVDEGEGEADVAVHGPAGPQVRGEPQAQQARLDGSNNGRNISSALGCFFPRHSGQGCWMLNFHFLVKAGNNFLEAGTSILPKGGTGVCNVVQQEIMELLIHIAVMGINIGLEEVLLWSLWLRVRGFSLSLFLCCLFSISFSPQFAV